MKESMIRRSKKEMIPIVQSTMIHEFIEQGGNFTCQSIDIISYINHSPMQNWRK